MEEYGCYTSYMSRDIQEYNNCMHAPAQRPMSDLGMEGLNRRIRLRFLSGFS